MLMQGLPGATLAMIVWSSPDTKSLQPAPINHHLRPYLTDRFGLITDYLAEAFHYQLRHNNRYEEVSKRLRLGSAVEGRDEKGIKKTLCALLKILASRWTAR